MEAVILIPGIEGSRLSLAETEIWPPDQLDKEKGYQKLEKLLDDKVCATGLVPDYAQLQNDIQIICGELHGQYVPFFYDWRKDFFVTATVLAQKIENLTRSQRITKITLVCHSMGGLIGRLLLEATYLDSKPGWFSTIKRLICICTPHLGAPYSLLMCMGLEDAETLKKKDIQTLSGDKRYPAIYELLPAPGQAPGRIVLRDHPKKKLDFYKPSVANAFGLNSANLKKARRLFNALKLEARPQSVDYQFIFGTDQPTLESIIEVAVGASGKVESWKEKEDFLGDGEVPIWSGGYVGSDAKIGTWKIPAQHDSILEMPEFKQKLRSYFGLTEFPTDVQKDQRP